MTPQKVALITGITGQDGSYLAELLLAKGYAVHGIKRRSSLFNTERVDHIYQDPHVDRRNFYLHYGDLSDGSNLTRIVQQVQPDEIYNLGAQSHVAVSFESPEYTADVDGLGTLRLLEAIRLLGLQKKTRFYQASTSELYGLVQETPQRETTPFYPRSPYGVAKLYAYWITVNYRESYGMYACNGILFNHESPRRGETFVTRKITRGLAQIAQGLDSCLYLGNLDALRDWGHAKDYVRMQWMTLQQDQPQDFVIATGVQYSVRDFITLAARELGVTLRFAGSWGRRTSHRRAGARRQGTRHARRRRGGAGRSALLQACRGRNPAGRSPSGTRTARLGSRSHAGRHSRPKWSRMTWSRRAATPCCASMATRSACTRTTDAMTAPPRIYVAGHRGMVGSAIVRTLLAQGHDPAHLVTRTHAELDLTNQAAVQAFFAQERPDQVYLAAAKVGGIHANNTYPADFIYDNLMLQANVVHAAHQHGVQKLLFLGSSCIYPRLASQPMAEDALLTGPLEPTNEPYAIAKIAGIKLYESYNRQHGRDYRSVMPTKLYGPGDKYPPENSHVIPALIRRFHEAKLAGAPSVTIWGTGTPRREFLYVDDMAAASVFVMQLDAQTFAANTQPMQSHLNVGFGSDVSIAELAALVAKTVGYGGQLVFDASQPDGAPRKWMDSGRLRTLGWEPRVQLAGGLACSYADFTAHRTG